MKSAENLLNNLLNGSLELNYFRTWISNFTAQGLFQKTDEPITQIEFILYFLNFLREKSRFVTSQIQKNTENKPKRVITHQPEENNENLPSSHSNEEFSKEDFPTLESSVVPKQGTKSMRRINPTPLNKDLDEGKKRYPKNKQETKNNVTCDINITKQTREKYANRFSSSLRPSNKKNVSFVPLDKKTRKLPAQYEKKIIIIIDIYICLLKNNVVPNLSDEIQFLLNLFNDIYVYTDKIISKTISYNDSTLLGHIIDWQYFCIEIFIRLDSIILKMDYNIKTFLHKSISSLNFQNNEGQTIFLQKLEVPSYKNQVTLIPFKNIYKDTSGMNSDCFDSKHDAFFKLKKKWKLDGSDNALVELDFLLTFKDNIISMNSFGKIFVESLVTSLEDSRRENRLNKLTQRFSNRQYQEDNGFYLFEVFYKWVVDFCFAKCPQHLLYIKYWLLNFIKSLSKEYLSAHGTEAYDDGTYLKNRFVSGLFLKITLAKFLGYIEFWEIKKYDNLPETEELILSNVHKDLMPRIDISGMLLWAVQEGQLTNTIPWIVQFISMSNKFIYSLPYYKEILIILISISSSRQVPLSKEDNLRVSKKLLLNDEEDSLVKLSILTPKPKFFNATDSRKFNFNIIFLKKSAMFFLNLWIGKLFNNKILGEEIYFNILQEYINIVKETKLNLDTVPGVRTTDSVFEVDEEIFLLLCSHFSRMTYWEQNLSTPPNKLVRNIRPILLESEEEQSPTDDIDVRAMLEDQFLKENKNLSIIIECISNGVFEVFLNKIDKLVSHKELEEGHYCKLKRLIEECHLRIDQSITALIQNDAEKPMRDVTISICFRRFISKIKKWLILHDYEVENEFFINLENVPETYNGNQSNIYPKLSIALQNLNMKIIELNKNECVQQNINATVDDLTMVCKEMFEKNDILNRTKENPFWDDLHILSWDYVLEILTNQPQLITEVFLEKMSLFWKEYFQSVNNAERLFCPRLIKASILKDKSEQKLIAYNIAQISFWVFKHKLTTMEELEQAYLGILHHTWNEDELNFLLMTFSEINACVKKDGHRELLSTIDFVLDSIIDIMEIDNMKKTFE